MPEKSMEDIAELFRRMRFKKRIIGGVDERDVWRKLDTLQKEYRKLYEAREIKYRELLKINGINPDSMEVNMYKGDSDLNEQGK